MQIGPARASYRSVDTALAAASIWSGVGDLNTCPGHAASNMSGPILAGAHEFERMRFPTGRPEPDATARTEDRCRGSLTPAELKVAWLAASGMPYKVIADRLNKSFATVDHQLRSIRRKLQVRSHAELSAVLANTEDVYGDPGVNRQDAVLGTSICD